MKRMFSRCPFLLLLPLVFVTDSHAKEGGMTLAAAIGAAQKQQASKASTAPGSFKPMFGSTSSLPVADPKAKAQTPPPSPAVPAPVALPTSQAIPPAPSGVQAAPQAGAQKPLQAWTELPAAPAKDAAVPQFSSRKDGDMAVEDVEEYEDPTPVSSYAGESPKKGQDFGNLEARTVEVKISGGKALFNAAYLERYPEEIDPFVRRSKDFSDGFEQDVYLYKGVMYSSDLQWEFDAVLGEWVPVVYRFHVDPLASRKADPVDRLGLLKIQLGQEFVAVGQKFLTDPAWHKKMQDSWAAVESESRVANYDAYLKFMEAAQVQAPVATSKKEKPSLKSAGKKVIAARKSVAKPEAAPKPEPMVITVNVGGAGQAQQVGQQQAPLQGFGSAVNPVTGQPVAPGSSSYVTPSSQTTSTRQTGGSYSADSTISTSFAGAGSGAAQDAALNDPLVKALIELSETTVAQCKGLTDETNELALKLANKGVIDALVAEQRKTAKYQFAFFNIKSSENLSKIVEVYSKIKAVAESLQKKSNLLFYGLNSFSSTKFNGAMKNMVEAYILMLKNIFNIQDSTADANAISIYSMFNRFTQNAKASEDSMVDLFKAIKDIFQTTLNNHGLMLWMSALGFLNDFSKLMRYSINVWSMPVLTTTQVVTTSTSQTSKSGQSSGKSSQGYSSSSQGYSSYSSSSSGSVETSALEVLIGRLTPQEIAGFPGYHGSSIALYNQIAGQLQTIFLKLKDNYSKEGSRLGLIDIINQVFGVIESKEFFAFILGNGFEERLRIPDLYPEVQPLVSGGGTMAGQSYSETLSRMTSSDFVVDIVAGVLRELIVNKLIYIIGLINTEVFTLSGITMTSIFGANSSVAGIKRNMALTKEVKIATGCLNRALVTNFLVSTISGNSSDTTETKVNKLMTKDRISEIIYNNWAVLDSKNKNIFIIVYGATSLDCYLIGTLNQAIVNFKKMDSSVQSIVSAISKVDARVTNFMNQMKSLGAVIADSRFQSSFMPKPYKVVLDSMDRLNKQRSFQSGIDQRVDLAGVDQIEFWPISRAVSLRLLKLVLMFYNKISWPLPDGVLEQKGGQLGMTYKPSLNSAFKDLALVIKDSTFLQAIPSLDPNITLLKSVPMSLSKIADSKKVTQQKNESLWEKNLYATSEALMDYDVECNV